ncbi:molecular chaperone DjlA [Thiospirochaeta perfilievii]|uniref:Molecular chaperone DjlA n=1 Tax=Thiospirochaeta perfilievii TaxID=252967 RepID=A0A5C1QBT3_9SPIO|nr:TerB family tellurite resistance protein [Thiospirochaeta perfilievii]QEN04977.1 molecular chaperone DjlA [Thiospirochaeta perfilievii]
MGWYGKIAGATIGFIIGGPLGAAGGAFIGHKLLDNDNNLSHHEEVQANYFVALFSMLGKMAKADGIVTSDEVRAVEYVISNRLRLNSEQRSFAIKVFNEAKDSSYSFENFANNFYKINSNQPNLLFFMLNTLFEVAKADGQLHEKEEELLKLAKSIFKISDHDYNNLKTQHFPRLESEKHYATLNCTPKDSDQTIKSSYRKLVQDFHPDKIQNKGLPEEFSQYAKVKFQEIQDAYDYIRKERNF